MLKTKPRQGQEKHRLYTLKAIMQRKSVQSGHGCRQIPSGLKLRRETSLQNARTQRDNEEQLDCMKWR